jgi:hypothetical protein
MSKSWHFWRVADVSNLAMGWLFLSFPITTDHRTHQHHLPGKISGSKGGEYEDDCSPHPQMLCRVVSYKLTDFSEMLIASIHNRPDH